ncbi:MAG: beta-propeller domain-containing protein, partial [Planctomycetota bacterium]
GNMIWIVSAEGNIEWEYPAQRPQDVWQLSNGNILFSHVKGAKEVTRDKEVVWEYSVGKDSEVHACQPLSDGNYLVAVSGPCEILEIDPAGKIVKRVKLVTNQKNKHRQMRQARKLANGNYIVGHSNDQVVREYDGDGKVIRTIEVKPYAFGGWRLRSGNTIITTGDGHSVFEVDPAGNVVWEINENDLEGNPLRLTAGIQRLANGNTVICNWGGHGHVGGQPQIVEVTPEKEVVWEIFDFERFGTISNVQLLDEKGDVRKGEILR